MELAKEPKSDKLKEFLDAAAIFSIALPILCLIACLLPIHSYVWVGNIPLQLLIIGLDLFPLIISLGWLAERKYERNLFPTGSFFSKPQSRIWIKFVYFVVVLTLVKLIAMHIHADSWINLQ